MAQSAIEEPKIEDGKVFVMTATQKGDGVNISTEFLQTVSGRQTLYMLKMMIRASLQTAKKFGEGFGISDDDVVKYLFDFSE